MKLYKFYQVHSKEELRSIQDLSLEDKYILYAFTNDKKIRKVFKETRNMKKFLEIVTPITKEEWEEFANQERGKLLDIYMYKYLPDKVKPDMMIDDAIIEMPIVSTYFEREFIDEIPDGIVDSPKSPMYRICPLFLRDKYIRALKILGYIDYWAVYGDSKPYEELLSEFGIDGDFDSLVRLMPNQVNLFIKLYMDLIE